MPELILYLLKANVALALFYLTYYFVLRKLTFYHLNRFFLVFGIVFSAMYPLINLNKLFSFHQELEVIQTYAVTIPAYTLTTAPEQAAAFDYWLLPVTLFWVGSAFMVVRFIMQLVSLYKIHRASEPDTYQGVAFRKVNGISEAFSFWKTIYLNPTQHRTPELESILKHEQIHVHGLHTLDVLLAEISTVFYWFNPGAWLMKKAMKENLEFIADQHVVDAGADKREYQYLLLKVVGATQPQIANQFNFPSLKRRIAMMNKMPTQKVSLLRLLIVLPLVSLLLFAFRSPSQANETAVHTQKQINDDVIYYIDGVKATKQEAEQLSPTAIHSVNVFKGELARKVPGNKSGYGVISLITVKNKDTEQVHKFQEQLPKQIDQQESGSLPPPPPPVKHKEPLIPEGTEAKIVENDKYVTYILWPGDIMKGEFSVVQKTFKASGFDLDFKEKFNGNQLNNLKITITSPTDGSKKVIMHDAQSLKYLYEANNIFVIKADKQTKEIITGTTIAKR